MAKKTRKVLKQESQQRAIQQAVANVNTTIAPADAPAQPAAVAAPARAANKMEISEEQEFAYVKSDVRRSLSLAALFAVGMLVLSFIVH